MKYVLGFLFDDVKNIVLLLKKEKPSWQKGKLNGIGGKVDFLESPEVAMFRECKEEIRHEIKWDKFFTLIDNNGNELHLFRSFKLKDVIYELKSYNDVGEEIIILEIDKFDGLKSMCLYNLHWMVNMALDKTIKTGIVKVTSLKYES